MPAFSQASLAQLVTCHADLQRVLSDAIKIFDFTVLEGFRNQKDQDAAFDRGDSQLRWPNGKHNRNPSIAVDIAPYPVDWANTEAARQRFVYLAGFVMASAARLNIPLRWGGDWNSDHDTRDEHFRDLGHFELVGR